MGRQIVVIFLGAAKKQKRNKLTREICLFYLHESFSVL